MDNLRLEDLLNRHVDGALAADEQRELEQMLLGSPEARAAFWRVTRLHSQIRASYQSQAGRQLADVDAASCRVASAENEPLPVIVVSDAAPSATWQGPVAWLSQIGPLSYSIATVLVGVAMLVASVVTVPRPTLTARRDAPSPSPVERPVAELVGRITGTMDCRWADTAPAAMAVPLGGKYALRSGLLEISYDTGAKVILEGPCTYEVESARGGFLSLGKLTARVEKSEIRNPKSEGSDLSSLISYPSSLFSVRTPTAVVTDLGTEFGVEVTGEGHTDAHVFQGSIRVVAIESGGDTVHERICRKGEAVRIGAGGAVTGTFAPAGGTAGFVRAMPPPESVRQSQAYADLVLSLRPAAYYRMERPRADKGRYVVFDSAPGGHHGELRLADPSGSPYVSGRFGDALWFCGPEMSDLIGDRVLVRDYPKATNGRLTVSAWVMAVGRPESAMIASNWGIPDGEHENTGQFQLCLCRDEGDLAACVTQRDGRRVEVREGRDSPLPLRAWQHVALVADGTTLHLYRNGKEVASGACAGLLPNPPLTSLGIGCRTNKANTDAHPAVGQYAWFWRGGIDELAIFNRALSPQTIEQLYVGKPNVAGTRSVPAANTAGTQSVPTTNKGDETMNGP